MNKDYEYILEPYTGANSRFECPKCRHRNEFTRYKSRVTGEYLPYDVGVCNRVSKCGYSYSAAEYFKQNRSGNGANWSRDSHRTAQQAPPPKIETEYIPFEKVEPFLDADLYKHNNFLKFLKLRFGRDVAIELAERYFIGTLKTWNTWNDSTTGGTLFLQVDTTGRIHQANKMLYDATTGKRRKDKNDDGQDKYSRFCGREILGMKQNETVNLQQCLFGEHLLRENDGRKIAVVEAAKTAIIASAYLPEYIWIATNTQSQISLLTKCEALRGRDITLFADLKSKESKHDWNYKIEEIKSFGVSAKLSGFLEKQATQDEKLRGYDLADYLLQHDLFVFKSSPLIATTAQAATLGTEEPTLETGEPTLETEEKENVSRIFAERIKAGLHELDAVLESFGFVEIPIESEEEPEEITGKQWTIEKQKELVLATLDRDTENDKKRSYADALRAGLVQIELSEPVNESELTERILERWNLEPTPKNNTRAVNFIFQQETDGFLVPYGSEFSHIWQEVKLA